MRFLVDSAHLILRDALAFRAMAGLSNAPLALVAALALQAIGCGNALESLECDKLRGEAFELINVAHHCNSDIDCRVSDWPVSESCDKPVNNKNYDAIKVLGDKFKAGQCEEPPVECRKAPVSYCKQGLCVFREASKVADAPAATDEIKIE